MQVRTYTQGKRGDGALDQEERDILDGIWPGVSDSSLLTCFTACHFADDVEAYVPFSWWADSCALADPDVAVCVEEWFSLHQPDSPCHEVMDPAGREIGGVDNMCNKTCYDLISAESPAAARDLFPAGRTPPSRHVQGSNSGYRDLCTIFPPSLKRTPAQVAVNHVEESEIALQACEEGDRVLRVQALREKYKSTAYLRQSSHHMQSNERLVGKVPDLSMAVLLPTPLIPDRGTRSERITQEAGDGAKDKDAVPPP